MERSTVCTNFYGAYEQDMAKPGASVTLRFCPEATKYFLTWGNGDREVAQITSPNTQVVIPGSDLVSRGPLKVTVVHEFPDNPEVKYPFPLGDFTLAVGQQDGKSLLSGTWDTTNLRTFLGLITRPDIPFTINAVGAFVVYLLDQLLWFQRDRCRETPPSSESVAFNASFNVTSTYSPTTISGWLGVAALGAKLAFAPLSERRQLFRGLYFLMNKLSDTDNLNAYFSGSSCNGTNQLPDISLSDDQISQLPDAAVITRKADAQLRAIICRDGMGGDYSFVNDALSRIGSIVPTPMTWRLSNEPDKDALELAYVRLLEYSFISSQIGDIPGILGCNYRSWGQEVWTPEQIDNYLHPTTTTDAATTTTAESTTTSVAVAGQQQQGNAQSSDISTTVPTTEVLPSSDAAVATAATNSRPLLIIGKTLSAKDILNFAGLPYAATDKLTMKIVGGSGKVCSVGKNMVKGKSAGLCKLNISTQSKGKKAKKASLAISVGAS